MEEPLGQGTPGLTQPHVPACGACPPGAPLSRMTSLSERISSPMSTQLKQDIEMHIALLWMSRAWLQVH